ncbi:MAG TPA: riboflavin synthase [Gemmatimonadaceae bacterium]|nr:riboflavin synthase [Gemmatimonadaceae bacterium]
MFSGLVDDVGLVEHTAQTDAGLEVRVRCRYDDLAAGESVSVNGVCLTVRERGPDAGGAGGSGSFFFTTAAMLPTLSVTTVGDWRPGRRVNLERALRASDRLGGHIVQGHVDAVALVVRAEMLGDAFVVDLAVPSDLSDLMVPRGSIAVDGVSLTISGMPAADVVQVSLIEYTRNHTTLGALNAGDRVNVEADVLAKHVRRLLAPQREAWRAAPDAH